MLVIFAPLDLDPKDTAWIEAVRRRHDPQAGLMAAHITLVFPFDGVAENAVSAHARAVCAGAAPIWFRLASAVAVRDLTAPRSHVFLMPDEGAAEIVALHDRLYAGPLAPHLRIDLPYAPHVTVAAFGDHTAAERLARELGPIDISGLISEMVLASLGDGGLSSEQGLRLGVH